MRKAMGGPRIRARHRTFCDKEECKVSADPPQERVVVARGMSGEVIIFPYRARGCEIIPDSRACRDLIKGRRKSRKAGSAFHYQELCRRCFYAKKRRNLRRKELGRSDRSRVALIQ